MVAIKCGRDRVGEHLDRRSDAEELLRVVDATPPFAPRREPRCRTALLFGKQKINLHRAGAEITPHAAQPAPGSADICLLIDEPVEQAALELAAAGLEIELGPVDRTGAERPIQSLYLRDPDGNLVELAH